MPYVTLPDGTVAIVKMPKPRARRCAGWNVHASGPATRCARASAYQCDWPVTGETSCDAHLCAEHAVEVAPNVHYCGPHHARHRKALAQGGLFGRLGVV